MELELYAHDPLNPGFGFGLIVSDSVGSKRYELSEHAAKTVVEFALSLVKERNINRRIAT